MSVSAEVEGACPACGGRRWLTVPGWPPGTATCALGHVSPARIDLEVVEPSMRNGSVHVLPSPVGGTFEVVLREAFLGPIVPVPKGNHKKLIENMRTRKPMLVEGKRGRRHEATLAWLARAAAPERPYDGPVGLDVVVVLPRPAAGSQGFGQELPWGKWQFPGDAPRSRPSVGDRGNYLKMLEDALVTGGWLVDDVQIVDGRVAKRWGDEPGYQVRMFVPAADA
jgi:Holliday junction resolvase RusA-like endonuclease